MSEFYQRNDSRAINSTTRPRKLLDQVRDMLRTKHDALRTEQAYVQWIRRFILHHQKRHPAEMGGPEVEQFLTWLATQRNVAASMQTRALSALLFLYKYVLKKELPLLDAVRAKRPLRLDSHPVIFTHLAIGLNDRYGNWPKAFFIVALGIAQGW